METSGDTEPFQTSSEETSEQELSLEELIEKHETLQFWKLRKRKGLFDSISRQVKTEIDTILSGLPEEELSKKEAITEVLRVIDTVKSAKKLNTSNICGELIDMFPMIGFTPYSLVKIISPGLALFSLAHKHSLNQKLSALDDSLKNKFPEILWEIKEIDYFEEKLEIIDSLLSLLSLITFVFLEVFGTIGVAFSCIEIYFGCIYRKKLLDIQLELFETVKKIQKEGAKELVILKQSLQGTE